MTITFIGHGYVGLVSAAVFADLGNTVWVIGHTPSKIENLKKGKIPIYEPGLEELVERNIKAGRLLFTLSYNEAIIASSVVFIAVGTPPKKDGSADLSVVFDVAKKIGTNIDHYTVVVTKSTVPVGTNREIRKVIEGVIQQDGQFDVASAPEFLREGQAITDTLHPDRIVIGVDTEKAKVVLSELHTSIDAPIIHTTIETAEMIKYAANAFLATKISFANAIAQLSERVGADALEALLGVGMDKRIGKAFLSPGAGYGGSCFPKDVKALIAIAKQNTYDFTLLEEVEKVNEQAIKDIVHKSKGLLGETISGKKIAIWGLSFKPDTDDMRDAPSIVIIEALQKDGASITVYDPIAMDNARKILKNVTFARDAYAATQEADLLIIVTEWNEFKEAELEKVKSLMRHPAIMDARNIYEPQLVKKLGFSYMGVGRR